MKKVLLCWIICLFPFTIFAQDQSHVTVKDPASLEKSVSDAARQTSSIRCDFTQVKHLSFLEESVISGGIFYFRNDDRLRWEYTRPFPYIIVLAGQKISILDGERLDEYDAGQNPVFAGIARVLSGIVNGSLFRDKDFKTAYFEKDGNYLMVLEPQDQNMRTFLSRIELTINRNNFGVDGVRLVEMTGDFTDIRFSNKKVNVTVPDEIFFLP